jgi:hypothetical protein
MVTGEVDLNFFCFLVFLENQVMMDAYQKNMPTVRLDLISSLQISLALVSLRILPDHYILNTSKFLKTYV